MRKMTAIATLAVVFLALVTPLVTQACGGGPVIVDAPLTRLAVGSNVMVDTSLDTPLVLRATPDRYGSYLEGLMYGTKLTVIDGPVRSNGYMYWKVTSHDGLHTGWVAEGAYETYWLKPLAA
jgi:hypothetical protein